MGVSGAMSSHEFVAIVTPVVLGLPGDVSFNDVTHGSPSLSTVN